MEFEHNIVNILNSYKFPINTEKELQECIKTIFNDNGIKFQKEYRLDEKSIVDFYINGIAIEIKIKGSAKNIYRQCVRYCENEKVKTLILVSSKSMGFPEEINNKSCYFVNLSKNYL